MSDEACKKGNREGNVNFKGAVNRFIENVFANGLKERKQNRLNGRPRRAQINLRRHQAENRGWQSNK